MSNYKDGDILGFAGNGAASRAIQIGTYGWLGGCSHVGIIADGLFWESTTLSELPCEILKDKKPGVQAHKIDEQVSSYGGRIYHYKLTRPLYSQEKRRLTKLLVDLIYTPYDMREAILSAGIIIPSLSSIFAGQERDDAHRDLNVLIKDWRLFCSELVALSLSYIGVWPCARASKWNPNRLLRRLRNDGILAKPERIK